MDLIRDKYLLVVFGETLCASCVRCVSQPDNYYVPQVKRLSFDTLIIIHQYTQHDYRLLRRHTMDVHTLRYVNGNRCD